VGAQDNTYTWDQPPQQGGAYRADLGSLGGAQVTDGKPNPDKGSEVYAGLVNELQRQTAGLNRTTHGAVVWIRFTSGPNSQPFVFAAQGMPTAAASTSPPFFTAARPAGAPAGVVQLTWVPGTLPPQLGEPETFLNSGPGTAYGTWIATDPNGVLVFTFDAAGTPTDQAVGVKVH
jgi:hypothetical protein